MIACPTCKRATAKDGNRAFPFCCDRCRMVDLGRWLGEEYRVPVDEPVDPEAALAARRGGDES